MARYPPAQVVAELLSAAREELHGPLHRVSVVLCSRCAPQGGTPVGAPRGYTGVPACRGPPWVPPPWYPLGIQGYRKPRGTPGYRNGRPRLPVSTPGSPRVRVPRVPTVPPSLRLLFGPQLQRWSYPSGTLN